MLSSKNSGRTSKSSHHKHRNQALPMQKTKKIEAVLGPHSYKQPTGCLDGKKMSSARHSKESSGRYKRKPEEAVALGGGPPEKRPKLVTDGSTTRRFSALLKALMKHPTVGKAFDQPVDPETLKMNPDYITLIMKPMVLGTIKSNLDNNTYLGIQEFLADIRQVIYNVMLYNPSSNKIHKKFREIAEFFEARWKSLGAKWNHQENSKVRACSAYGCKLNRACPIVCTPGANRAHGCKSDCQGKSTLTSEMRKSDIAHSNKPVSAFKNENVCLSSNLATPATDADLAKGLLTPKKALRTETRKRHSADTSLKAQQKIKTLVHNGEKADRAKMRREKEKSERRQCKENPKIEAQIMAAEAAAKKKEKVDLERQSERDRKAARIALEKMENTAGIELNLDIEKELDILSGCSLSRGNPLHRLGLFLKDEYLEEAALNDDIQEGKVVCHSSQLTTPGTATASAEGSLTPKKALRAAMLKCHFADTIFKAQQIKTLHDKGKKADPTKMQQEKEKFKRKQQQEKAKIEARINASAAAAEMKAKVELKMQRERDRKAARIALEKMENTAGIELNWVVQREFEILIGCSHSQDSPLHHSGLFLKDKHSEKAARNEDIEEGEIEC